MAHMDVFKQSAFSMRSLTNAIQHLPHLPRRLGQMGMFSERPIRTTGFTVEEQDSILSMVPTSERGAPLDPKQRNPDRVAQYIRTPRLAQQDTVYAHEVQDWRAFGSESELQVVQNEIARRLGSENSSEGLLANLELTREHHRLGAIQGQVLDADGTTVLYDWSNVFGITPEPMVNFPWPAAASDEGVIRKICNQIIRTMMRNSRGAWAAGQTMVWALCGDNFYDELTQNRETRHTYIERGELNDLTTRFGAFEGFQYGSIVFENYRGTDDNTTVAIPTDECRFFPVGGAGIFQVVLSPAEFFEYVNQPGQPEYAMTIPDMKRNAFVELEVYSYPAYMCTRPKMLMRGQTQP